MRRLLISAPGLAIIVSFMAQAIELDGSLGAASDTLFRGVSQTGGPVVRGGLDWYGEHLYAGGELSNNRLFGRGAVETYGGYTRPVSLFELLPGTIDTGVDAHLYFGERIEPYAGRSLDFAEIYAGGSLGPASLKLYASPDYANRGAPGYSLRAALKWPLMSRLELRLSLAYNGGAGVQRWIAPLTADGRGRNYVDYGARLQLTLPRELSAYLQGGGTDLKLGAAAPGSVGQPKLMLGLRKDFSW